MLCRIFLLSDLRIIVRKRPTGHKGYGQQCSHKDRQQALARTDIQFDTSLLQGLPRWMSDPTSPRLNGPRARSSPPRIPPGKHQPVHQLLRFLVERGILTRIPSSAPDFPHARAAPSATIYANNRRIVPRLCARACRSKDSIRSPRSRRSIYRRPLPRWTISPLPL